MNQQQIIDRIHDGELSEEELEHLRMAALMSMGIEKKQIHKMIEG